MKFVNFSNHPSEQWGEKQRCEAEKWGAIVDVAFPNVDPAATKDEVRGLAKDCVDKILIHNPGAVMCQGEFSLAYAVINLLKEREVKVVAACSKREVTEQIVNGNETRKSVVFEFVGFREY